MPKGQRERKIPKFNWIKNLPEDEQAALEVRRAANKKFNDGLWYRANAEKIKEARKLKKVLAQENEAKIIQLRKIIGFQSRTLFRLARLLKQKTDLIEVLETRNKLEATKKAPRQLKATGGRV